MNEGKRESETGRRRGGLKLFESWRLHSYRFASICEIKEGNDPYLVTEGSKGVWSAREGEERRGIERKNGSLLSDEGNWACGNSRCTHS